MRAFLAGHACRAIKDNLHYKCNPGTPKAVRGVPAEIANSLDHHLIDVFE